jgi:hypothetical protein
VSSKYSRLTKGFHIVVQQPGNMFAQVIPLNVFLYLDPAQELVKLQVYLDAGSSK